MPLPARPLVPYSPLARPTCPPPPTCPPAPAPRPSPPSPPSAQGFGYVEFEGEEGLAAALAHHGAALKGRTLDVSRSRPPKSAADHTAFVKGLGNEVGEPELRRLFGDAPGGIIAVRMPRDGGRSKVRCAARRARVCARGRAREEERGCV